jgi:hypothetical protein
MAEHKVKLIPLNIPELVFVRQPPGNKGDGPRQNPGIPITELSYETLRELMDEFEEGLYKAAGKSRPFTRQ